VLRLVLSLPFGLCAAAYYFSKVLLNAPALMEQAERAACQRDYAGARAEGHISANGAEAELVVNSTALRALALGIEHEYQAAATHMANLPGGEVSHHTPGWHTHSEFFCPFLPFDLSVGTGPGMLRLQGPTHLFAAPSEWRRITAYWLDIAAQGQACLLVLDKAQSGWCSPDSQGRLLIEVRPGWDLAITPGLGMSRNA